MSMMEQGLGDKLFAANVDESIIDELYGGQGDGMAPFEQRQPDQLAAVATALGIVERHIEVLTPRQLGALMLLKAQGGRWSEIADQYMQHRHLMGPADQILAALEHLNPIRTFKGYTGSMGRMWGGGRRR